MARGQSASLDRKKLFSDPVMMGTIVLLIVFLTVFILYPLAILMVDSIYSKDSGLTLRFFQESLQKYTFTRAITNTLKVGFLAAGRVAAFCAFTFHDHAVRKGRYYHPAPAGHL